MSEILIYVLKGSALDCFLNNFDIKMKYSDFACSIIQQYNPPHRCAALPSEVIGIRFSTFKQILGIDTDRGALTRKIKHLSNLVPQLAADFKSECPKDEIS